MIRPRTRGFGEQQEGELQQAQGVPGRHQQRGQQLQARALDGALLGPARGWVGARASVCGRVWACVGARASFSLSLSLSLSPSLSLSVSLSLSFSLFVLACVCLFVCLVMVPR